MHILVAALLLHGLATEAAAEPAHIRRQNQYTSYANSSTSVASSSSDTTRFSYDPVTTSSISLQASSSLFLPSTTSDAASSALITSQPPPYPSSGASSYFPITASRVRPPIDRQCSGQTINVRSAFFDWWNPYTVDHPVSKLSFQHDSKGVETGWTILPDGADFTIASQFQEYDCDSAHPYTITDGNPDDTWTSYDCSYVPLTLAASTTVTTLTAFRQPTATTGTRFDVPDVRATIPPDPSITFAAVNSTYAPGTDYVYFSQYELENSDTTTYANGSQACVTATTSYNLSAPYALPYTGPPAWSASDPVAAVTGDLGQDFATYVGAANATAGAYTAVPTVIVIVEEIFHATFVLYAAATIAQTASELDTPSAQLPPGISATPTTDNWASDLYTSLTNSARTEHTASILLVPPPSTTSEAVVASQQAGDDSGSSAGDANSVLSQALGPAIMQGLGSTSVSPTITVAGTTASPTSVSAVVVAGQTAFAGGSALTLGGTTISLAGDGNRIVVNGQTSQLPGGSPATFDANGIQATATKAVAYDIAGQTLAAGGAPATVDGTRLSLASGGNALVVGSSTMVLSPPPVITIASETIIGDSATKFVLGPGQTLTKGGTAIISSTVVSLVSAGTAIVINGKTTAIGTLTAATSQITAGPVLYVDGSSYSPDKSGRYVINDQTLSAGGAITFTGKSGIETVSLDKAGTVLVDVVSGVSTTTTLSTSAPAITLGGQVFSAVSGKGSTYVIAGQTITPGAVKTVTVAGSTYVVSLASVPTAVVIKTLSNGNAIATSTETLVVGATSAAPAANKTPVAPTGSAAAASAPATGQASSMVMEMLTALFGAAALGAAALL